MQDLVTNKKAFFDYEILETFEAGLILLGTEVKSLREHGGNLQEGYIEPRDDALYLVNSSIAPYRYGTIYNHEERRPRKLLLHKKEIQKLKKAVQEKGLTIIALSMYLKGGKIKIKIALARGKKQYDKRKTIAAKEEKRRTDAAIKRHK